MQYGSKSGPDRLQNIYKALVQRIINAYLQIQATSGILEVKQVFL